MFADGKLTSRPMPLPLMVRFGSGGHDGATVVGKVNRIFPGPGGYWGEGEFLDPAMVPEVPKAIYMLNEHVMGPSVDLDRDFTVEAIKHPLRPDKKAGLFKEYNVIGVTLVPMPAFHQVHMSVDSDEDKALVASVMPDLDMSSWVMFDVNGDSWKSWPIAPRDYRFDADDAVKRIALWSGIGSEKPNLGAYASAFLWRNGNQTGDSLAQDSFRLPLADVINGQLYLIYHAAYAAAALLSGAHGGLPNIPDQDKSAMIPVLSEIYAALGQAFNDPNLVSPFEQDVRRQQAAIDNAEDCGCDGQFNAYGGEHNGAMIALKPRKADAVRLAAIGDEDVDELHCTLYYLGDADEFDESKRESVIRAVRHAFTDISPVRADGFSVNVFNPLGAQQSDGKDRDTCIVLGISGPAIAEAKRAADLAVGLTDADHEDQHEPYVAHVTLAYTNDLSKIPDLTRAAGPITFDRVCVAFGGEVIEIPLKGAPESEYAAVPMPPADVVKSMDEEDEAYGPDGEHVLVNGICQMCGYSMQEGAEPVSNVNIYVGDGVPISTINSSNATDYAAAKKQPYGDVKYADSGMQADGVKRYPLDSEEHCRAAWAYINMPKNAAKYTPEQLKIVKDNIREALKKYGVQVAKDSGQMGVDNLSPSDDAASLLASVAPLAPPAIWFSNPALPGPTPLTIDDSGHVFGHLAQWKVCHVGIGRSCVMAPKTRTNYQLFRVGTVQADDGSSVPIGKITLGTGHADAHWGIVPSREHYDNTGWAAAVVNVGEDKFGIWVNGSLTTTMTPERIAELRAASLSGDWREVNGNLELIAALAVNSPGFPIYREQNGRSFSLQAVGVIGQEEEYVDEEHRHSTEFANQEEVDGEVVGDEEIADEDLVLSAAAERLASIDEEWDEFNQDRRASQLAVIDEERAALAESKIPAGAHAATNLDDEIFVQYNARFQALQQE
jgi:2'-5' RNA ligase